MHSCCSAETRGPTLFRERSRNRRKWVSCYRPSEHRVRHEKGQGAKAPCPARTCLAVVYGVSTRTMVGFGTCTLYRLDPATLQPCTTTVCMPAVGVTKFTCPADVALPLLPRASRRGTRTGRCSTGAPGWRRQLEARACRNVDALAPRQFGGAESRTLYPRNITASISTAAPRGSDATPMVTRAGNGSLKYDAIMSFTVENLPRSVR
jgi:hypothetical protein